MLKAPGCPSNIQRRAWLCSSFPSHLDQSWMSLLHCLWYLQRAEPLFRRVGSLARSRWICRFDKTLSIFDDLRPSVRFALDRSGLESSPLNVLAGSGSMSIRPLISIPTSLSTSTCSTTVNATATEEMQGKHRVDFTIAIMIFCSPGKSMWQYDKHLVGEPVGNCGGHASPRAYQEMCRGSPVPRMDI